MHAVARQLVEYDARFTPFYGGPAVRIMRGLGLLEPTIGGNKRRRWCLEYLRDHRLEVDLDGRSGPGDLVVTCTDLVVQHNVRGAPLVVVQEGMVDRPGIAARWCKRLPWLPRWLAGTALTGQSGAFDAFCAASAGYRDRFVAAGADARKIFVTGIPNFDDCRRYHVNDFPHRDYFLVCTSDTRELYQRDDRQALLRRAVSLARGRQLVFKLHPNENHERATAEIRAILPRALVYDHGSAEEMIANADGVLAQWSSTLLVALALGKEVHSTFPIDELRALVPLQNGGQSAANIARVCRQVVVRSRAASLRRRHDDLPPGASGQVVCA
jgi:hypothetical protein